MGKLFARLPDSPPPVISAPPESGDISKPDGGGILADQGSPSPTPIISPTTSPTSSPPPAKTSTAPPPAHHGLKPGQVAAIVVPIVALVLLIPMVFLLYRSHQFRKAMEKRNSQRSSREAMLQRQSSVTQGPTSQAAALAQLGAREKKTRSRSPPKPTNSMGLFNFDISPPQTPSVMSPTSPRSPGRLSIAHLMPVRRSQASVIDSNRPSTARPSTSRNSRPSMLLEPPLAKPGPPSPQNPHFAPLNQIGLAYTHDSKRPSTSRSISSKSVQSQNRATLGSHLKPSDAENRPFNHPSQPSLGLLPPIPHGGLDLGNRFTVSDYARGERQTTISELGKSAAPSPPLDPRSQRYSDVSSLSDDDDYRRASHRLNSVSPVHDDRGAQPHRIL